MGNKGEFIFIGGTGRSGTTILSKFLASHRDYSRLPFELRLHTDPYGLYDLYRNLTVNWDVYRGSSAALDFERFYLKLLDFSYHSYHNITLKELDKKTYKMFLNDFFKSLDIDKENRLWIGNSPFLAKSVSMKSPKFSKAFNPKFYSTRYTDEKNFFSQSEMFYKRIFSNELRKSGYLIEHTPYNFLFFEFLNKVFPNSKFIHIKRNPFDIISSYSIQNWGSQDLNTNAKQIIDLYKKWNDKKPKLTNYIEISLEDLGQNTQQTLAKISDYLGANVGDFDSNMIDTDKLHIDRWKAQEKYFKSLSFYEELKECALDLRYEIT